MTVHEFIAKWRKVELKERSAAQEHFLDLCHVFDHPTPAAADPTGETFCFEKGAAKHGGGDGFADVWKRGFFGWEYKGKHKDLSAAFDQLLRYRDALENPPLLVLCDLDRLVVRTNFTGTVSAVHEIPLEALAEPRSIEIMRAVFHNPESLRPGRTSATVTQEAAVQIGEIAAAMRGRGLDPAAVAHFLDRIVFCLFAEDAGLLPDMVFSRMLEKAGGDPARFGKTLAMLFEAMATGGDFGLETIRHFNGSLFDDRTVPDLAPDDVKRFSAASSLDWSAVDPSIFGTLFERGLDPAKRAQLGAHFTGMADIELVVDAVVLTPLRREWQETKTVIENLLTTGKKTGSGNRESGVGSRESEIGKGKRDGKQDLQGTGRLAGGDGIGCGDLSADQNVAGHRTLRVDLSSAAVGSVGPGEHSGGLRAGAYGGVSAPSVHGEGLFAGTGDAFGGGTPSCLSTSGYGTKRARTDCARGYDAQQVDSVAQGARLTDSRFPTPDSRLPTPDSRLPTPDSRLPIPDSRRRKARGEATAILHQFLTRLHGVKILDPACGSGNFLYVALLRLKDMEKEAIIFGADNDLGAYLPGVGPWQLYGIEVNPYAHDLAQMTVWIGWLQWIRANGFGFPADPILRPLTDNILLQDAILGRQETGDGGTEPEWPTVDFIVGNPPFLGDKLMRRELGDAYVDQLRSLYANRIPGQSDLCCYWFEKARAHIAAGKCNRAGLLATQGIRGGANREVLKRIKDSGDIFWAESDRSWILDGANVHVSMVGFDGGEETSRLLDGKLVSAINANLTSAADTGIAHGLPANCDIGFIGTTKKAPLDISDDAAQKLLLSPNPHGRPNSDIVRPWMNGLHITRRELAQWIIDYPISFSQSDAALYEGPYAYVVENVKPIRDNHREAVQAKYWWRQARPCPEMQQAIAILPHCLVTPRVSKHRLFAWVDAVVVPDCQLVVFARADDYFFGVLHSRFHEVWALAQGTQLREKESGFRYTPTSCFESFPFPEADPDRDAAIASAARELNELREGWLNPPDWTRTETLEFPGTVGGPWNRYIDPATVHPLPTPDFRLPTPVLIGTVRYPRLVPRDADCAARLKERTLTKLYNARPAWLADCHARLDAAVAAAYGWPADLSDDAILERLLALNLERAKAK